MPESNINGITAPIYSADLLYEQNCKCGVITFLQASESWEYVPNSGDPQTEHKVWKIVALGVTNNSLAALNGNSPDTTDCGQIVTMTQAGPVNQGWEIRGDFTSVEVLEGYFILYKDCHNS